MNQNKTDSLFFSIKKSKNTILFKQYFESFVPALNYGLVSPTVRQLIEAVYLPKMGAWRNHSFLHKPHWRVCRFRLRQLDREHQSFLWIWRHSGWYLCTYVSDEPI